MLSQYVVEKLLNEIVVFFGRAWLIDSTLLEAGDDISSLTKVANPQYISLSWDNASYVTNTGYVVTLNDAVAGNAINFSCYFGTARKIALTSALSTIAEAVITLVTTNAYNSATEGPYYVRRIRLEMLEV